MNKVTDAMIHAASVELAIEDGSDWEELPSRVRQSYYRTLRRVLTAAMTYSNPTPDED